MLFKQGVSHRSPHLRISLEARLEGHTGAIESVRFAPDGSFLASCDQNTIRLWRQNQQEQWYQQSCLEIPARSLALSPDSSRIAVVNKDDSIEVWTIEGVRQAILLRGEQQGRDVAFSSDGNFLVTSDSQAHITFWQANTLQRAFETDCRLSGAGVHLWGPCFFTLAPNGKHLALLYPTPQGLVHIWEVDSEGKKMTWVKTLLGREKNLVVPYYSPDGKKLVLVGPEQGSIWLFHAGTLQLQEEISAPRNYIELGMICFSPDSQFFACDLLDGRVCVWSMITHQIVASIAAHPGLWIEQASSIGCLDWSSQGNRVVTGGASAFLHDPLKNDYSLKIWRIHGI